MKKQAKQIQAPRHVATATLDDQALRGIAGGENGVIHAERISGGGIRLLADRALTHVVGGHNGVIHLERISGSGAASPLSISGGGK